MNVHYDTYDTVSSAAVTHAQNTLSNKTTYILTFDDKHIARKVKTVGPLRHW